MYVLSVVLGGVLPRLLPRTWIEPLHVSPELTLAARRELKMNASVLIIPTVLGISRPTPSILLEPRVFHFTQFKTPARRDRLSLFA